MNMAGSVAINDYDPDVEIPRYPDGVVWKPQAGSQEAFLASTPIFEVLLEGSRGGGKTDALIMSFCQFVGKGFGAAWTGIIFRQTYKQLNDLIKKANKWIPLIWPQAKYNKSEHFWTFPDGEILHFKQFNKLDDYWNYHGHEYPFIAWEELCNWPNLDGYKRMFSCCRSSTPGMPRMIRATTNPYGPGHNIVKARFRLPGSRFKVIKDSRDEKGNLEPARLAIFSRLSENKVLLGSDPDYLQRILASARSDAERQAWEEGSWDIVAGGMFDDVWSNDVNVVRPFDIPESWYLDRAFDWGSSKPFSVGWYAESDGTDYIDHNGNPRHTVPGDLFRIGEWYGWNGQPNQGMKMLAKDVTRGIIEREREKFPGKIFMPGPADSAIFSEENGPGIAGDMALPIKWDDGTVSFGVRWTRADKRPGSRKTGWEMMRKMFKAAGRPAREEPGFYVWDTCEHFVRTVPVLPRKDNDEDDVNTESEDHVGDEVRYRVRFAGKPKPTIGGIGVGGGGNQLIEG